MNIAEACNAVAEIARNENLALLEAVIDYRNGCNDIGINNYYDEEENLAFRVFINEAHQFFAPAEV